jgi:hypothetical protein
MLVEPIGYLAAQERERLTYRKWRWVLQADGFTLAQARR